MTGRNVLFSGTPCQIDGLLAFLRKDYDNLLCVEVICHGAPSPALWKKYIDHLEKKHGAPIVSVNFRSKECSWRIFGSRLENSKRKVLHSTLRKDPYLRMFLRDIALRPSCYQCPSKSLQRNADLTIADFWGIEKVLPTMDDNRGTSLVLVHSQKGRAAFQAIEPKMHFSEVDCGAALESNPAMIRSAKRPAAHEDFYRDMQSLSFGQLAKKYVPFSIKEQIKGLLEKLGLLTTARALKRIVNH